MRKALFALIALLSASSAFAAIENAGRKYFDIGFGTGFVVDQNLMGANEVLKEDLVIDFSKIADRIGENGLVLNTGADADFSMYFGPRTKWGFGLYAGVVFFGRTGTGKGLWETLGYGNVKSSSTVLSTEYQAYAEVGVPVHFTVHQHRVKVVPNVYCPLFYVPYTESKFSYKSNDEWTFNGSFKENIPVYTCVNFRNYYDDSFNFNSDSEFDGSDQNFADSGFSLGFEVERKILKGLDVGVYGEIPVVPGKLKYKTDMNVAIDVSCKPVLDSLSDDETDDMFNSDFDFSLGETEECEYWYRKPLKLGGAVAWRPIGKWFCLRGKLGIGATNPFSTDFDFKHNLYPEFDLGMDIASFNYYGPGLYFDFGYVEQAWNAMATFDLNLRIIDITIKAGLSSTDFASMFQVSGAKVDVGFRMGF